MVRIDLKGVAKVSAKGRIYYETCARVGVRGFWPAFCGSSGDGEDGEGAFQVVGDGGEMDLDGGLSEAAPSHPTQAVGALPGSEDLLDAGADAMDRLVPGLQAGLHLGLVLAPHPRSDDAGG